MVQTLADLAPTVYKNEFHDFDHDKECKASGTSEGNDGGNGGGNGNDNLICCGSYPNRFEYNPKKHSCCDGSVKDFGTC